MRKSRVRQGSTLVELLVVGAVSTVLALGLGGILINSMKVSTSVTQTSDFNNMRTLITMALSNANPAVAPCSGMITVSTSPPSPTGQDALNGVTTASPALPTGGIALSQIANGSNVLATVGQNGSIQLTSITINPVVVGSPDPTTPIPYTTNLHLAGYKIQSNGFVPNAPTLFGDIPLQVTLSASGGTTTIASCTTGGLGAGGAVSAITCQTPVGFSGGAYHFISTDCGGTLPDSTYLGMISEINEYGVIPAPCTYQGPYIVVQPGSPGPFLYVGNGPGIYLPPSCRFNGMTVIYIKTH